MSDRRRYVRRPGSTKSTARIRRRELRIESNSFYGAMDGAAKFVRGDAIAGLIITAINIVGGLLIGLISHHMAFADAVATFTTLSAGDGLVAQIPSLLVSTAAGIVVTKGGVEGTADVALVHQLGRGPKPLAMAAGAPRPYWACCHTACRRCRSSPSPVWPAAALICDFYRYPIVPRDGRGRRAWAVLEPPIGESLRMDMIRLELGYGLLALAGGDGPRLTEQIKSLRRSIAADMGSVPASGTNSGQHAFVAHRVRDQREGDRSRQGPVTPDATDGEMDPKGGTPALVGEATNEPAFGLPAMWIDPSLKEEAFVSRLHRRRSADRDAVDASDRDRAAERRRIAVLRRDPETVGRTGPAEHQKLVADLMPSTITAGAVQRVLQSLLEERASIRDLPTILEGIQEAWHALHRGPFHRSSRACAGSVGAADQRAIHRRGGIYSAADIIAGLGDRVCRISDRAAGGTPTGDGARQAAGFRAAIERCLRNGIEQRRTSRLAEQRVYPRACPSHRGARETRHGRTVAARDFPAREDPDRGNGVTGAGGAP